MGDSLDDMIALSKARRAEKQASATDHRLNAPKRLQQAGISFQAKNGGAHLIVRHDGHTIDFWPGTALWIERGSSRRRHGIRGLIKHLTE